MENNTTENTANGTSLKVGGFKITYSSKTTRTDEKNSSSEESMEFNLGELDYKVSQEVEKLTLEFLGDALPIVRDIAKMFLTDKTEVPKVEEEAQK